MTNLLQSLDFWEENDLYKQGSSEIDLSALDNLLDIKQKELGKALKIHESQIGREMFSENAFLKQRMSIFNMLSLHIKLTEPNADKERVQLKISRWLKMPNTHFNNSAPLDMMIQGKTRKVIKLLEQITGES